MERRWLTISGFIIAALLLIGLAIISFNFYRLYYSPMHVAKDAPVIIRIDKFTPASSFVHMLENKKLIQSPRLLLILIRMQDLTQQLKAGVYQIKPGESATQFLNRVIVGDVLTASFRITEGSTQAQINAALQQAPYLTYEPSDWQVITMSSPSAEGLLLADTYQYDAGSRAKDLLEHAYKNLQQFLEQRWQHRSPDLPYKSPYELLIAASIIEKETAKPEERRLIAGVLINRLHKHMPLQMDPTVIYALGTRYKGKLTHEDLQIDSPYNTYLYRGLPPTPIAMVGKDAIAAAANPQPTNYLYFVATGDGGHFFSETYEEQKQAIMRYLK
jgi:UPF0755 protein